MGVRTTADESLDRADTHIKDAIRELAEIVVNQVWGHEEYNHEYREKIKKSLTQLIEVRDLLDR